MPFDVVRARRSLQRYWNRRRKTNRSAGYRWCGVRAAVAAAAAARTSFTAAARPTTTVRVTHWPRSRVYHTANTHAVRGAHGHNAGAGGSFSAVASKTLRERRVRFFSPGVYSPMDLFFPNGFPRTFVFHGVFFLFLLQFHFFLIVVECHNHIFPCRFRARIPASNNNNNNNIRWKSKKSSPCTFRIRDAPRPWSLNCSNTFPAASLHEPIKYNFTPSTPNHQHHNQCRGRWCRRSLPMSSIVRYVITIFPPPTPVLPVLPAPPPFTTGHCYWLIRFFHEVVIFYVYLRSTGW